MENLFSTHSTDRTYQRILRNECHQEKYKDSFLNDITPYGLQLKKHAQIETLSEDFPARVFQTERKLVNLLLEETKLVHQELEDKFNKDLITNFPQNHTYIKNDIISRNLTLKITLSDRSKKKWREFKGKNVIRTPRKSTKVSDFVEVALACSKYANVTDNRKHRKKIIRDFRQELNDGPLTNYNLNTFPGNKGAVIEEHHNTDVVLSN